MARNKGSDKGEDPLILALAAGMSMAEAADRAGISLRTAFRRQQDAGFKVKVMQARALMVDRALGSMADGASEAATTLRELLKDESGSIRLGAARSVLELGNRLRESVELEGRLSALEEKSKQEEQGP